MKILATVGLYSILLAAATPPADLALTEGNIDNIYLYLRKVEIDGKASPSDLRLAAGIIRSTNVEFHRHREIVRDTETGPEPVANGALSELAIRLLSKAVDSPPMTYMNPRWEVRMFFERSIWINWLNTFGDDYIKKLDKPVTLRESKKASVVEIEKEKLRIQLVENKITELHIKQARANREGKSIDFIELAAAEVGAEVLNLPQRNGDSLVIDENDQGETAQNLKEPDETSPKIRSEFQVKSNKVFGFAVGFVILTTIFLILYQRRQKE